MSATLALLICMAAIFVFFSQEFIGMFKRIFAVKGAKLVLPLLAGSWLIYSFQMEFLWFIIYTREALTAVLTVLMKLIPAQSYSHSIAAIILLSLLAILPVHLLDWLCRKKTHKAYPYPYLTSTLILIFSYLVLMV